MRFRPRFSVLSALFGAVLTLSFVLPLPRHNAILGLPPLCPFFNLTGWPCPGCGLTRSFVCLGHAQFQESFLYHPLGPLLFGALFVSVLSSFFGRAPRFSPRISALLLAASTSAMVAAWIMRLSGLWPLPT